MRPIQKYILLTERENYFVEYLVGELVLSDSISEAMVFEELSLAERFRDMLLEHCRLVCSVNSYIGDWQDAGRFRGHG